MVGQLKSFKSQRARIKSNLTRANAFFNNLATDRPTFDIVKYINERLDSIRPYCEEFEEVTSKIIELDLANAEKHKKEFDSFESNYNDTINRYETYLDSVIPQSDTSSQSIANSSHEIGTSNRLSINSNGNIRLPRISLPQFDGAYDMWSQFAETFNSLIHNNESIDPTQKFLYLQSCLKNEASLMLKSLSPSPDNYLIAWKLLSERYENKRLTINKHIEAIFEAPAVVKDPKLHLRSLLDIVIINLRALNALEQPVDSWNSLLIYLITNKLDKETRREWEMKIDSKELPKFAKLEEFLIKKCEFLEALPDDKNTHDKSKVKFASHTTTEFKSQLKCPECKGAHKIYSCDIFLALDPRSRFTRSRELRICTNCLLAGHSNKKCRSSNTCYHCNKRHNSLLHFSLPKAKNSTPDALLTNFSQYKAQVLLPTAMIKVIDSNGSAINCRALLDSGSQANFISNRICKHVNAQKYSVNADIIGINKGASHIKYGADIKIVSNSSNFSCTITCLVLDEITENLPQVTFDSSLLNVPKNIVLADSTFNINGQIDMLIGSNYFFKLLSVGQIQLGRRLPILQKTVLGWIVVGNFPASNSHSSKMATLNVQLDKALLKFWELEEIENVKQLSKNEELCESIYQSTTVRDSCGRFIVHIPLKHNIDQLGESRQQALQRFLSIERKLQKSPKMYESYKEFMFEYESLGHMSKAISDAKQCPEYFLPHHPVIRESSLTTKLRVVFDASAKTTSNLSLNDVQLVGPVIQQDIFSILIRFRTHKIALVADIAKMYRQILIAQEFKPLHKIFWRQSSDQPLNIYELNTITYGTSSASFLATRCLKELSIQCRNSHPVASEVIETDFYMDDLITGAPTLEEAIKLQYDVSNILLSAGFELRKWLSNNDESLKNVTSDENNNNFMKISDSTANKTLGVLWNSCDDRFLYECKPMPTHNLTKRCILSSISQFFDPLGFISPIIIKAKLIMQNLWQINCNWDESLPMKIHTDWLSFVDDINNINSISIPRYVLSLKYNQNSIEIHGFCDASEVAYGACIYIRTINDEGETSTKLLCAKSRVAPLKKITLPRLELSGALLLSRLLNKVLNGLKIKVSAIYLWSDSTIVLSWLNAPCSRWLTFVANRVSEIQSNTKECEWRHVNSDDNPADLLTRGTSVKLLNINNLWWFGPQWLKKSYLAWPNNQIRNLIDIPEQRNCNIICSSIQFSDRIFNRYSSFKKLIRVIAMCLRFYNNTHNPLSHSVASLSVKELNNAKLCLVKLAQKDVFFREISLLAKKERLPKDSKILSLNPFLDDKGILRVGGRLHKSVSSYDQIHPQILPSKHRLTWLLMQHEHKKLLHCGSETLLASVRCAYWPISGRNICRNIIRNCVKCFRSNPKPLNVIMGNLPENRLNPAPPFQITGVDYAGPFNIKYRNKRGIEIFKQYICLFICFVTKAIHLEVVSDLTSDCFIAALRRFASRRGTPSHIYSDNGTNFTGAKTELVDLYNFLKCSSNQKKIIEYSSNSGISWHFIPPKSPHFGGIWEAGIKTVKNHIKRVLGNIILLYDEFVTFITQVEAVVNSRPLTLLSTDSSDPEPLTPGHFLIGRPLIFPPSLNFLNISNSKLSCYQRIQKMTQHFWKRWSREYLNTLQVRHKWKQGQSFGPKINDIVILIDNNLPPLQWKLARVIAVHPGDDGVVRVITLKTSNGEVKRSTKSVCILPNN